MAFSINFGLRGQPCAADNDSAHDMCLASLEDTAPAQQEGIDHLISEEYCRAPLNTGCLQPAHSWVGPDCFIWSSLREDPSSPLTIDSCASRKIRANTVLRSPGTTSSCRFMFADCRRTSAIPADEDLPHWRKLDWCSWVSCYRVWLVICIIVAFSS